MLRTFKISRSLSEKGCPYDNAEAESLYHILKTEFVKGRTSILPSLYVSVEGWEGKSFTSF